MAKTEKIESITAYILFVEKNCLKENILFRGQQQDWPLFPKLARIKPKGRLRPVEYEMLLDFERLSLPHININLKHKLDKLAFAQHNGMATRLLDWTLNPLAALWFAVCIPPAKDEQENLKDGVVWIYHVSNEDTWALPHFEQYPEEGIFIHRPNHVTSQITAQQALFTLHGYDEDSGGFIAMEKHTPYCDRLTKLIIPGPSFSELRFQLDRCGINNASMFPGIGGLCKYIEWFHTLLDDEAKGNTATHKITVPVGEKPQWECPLFLSNCFDLQASNWKNINTDNFRELLENVTRPKSDLEKNFELKAATMFKEWFDFPKMPLLEETYAVLNNWAFGDGAWYKGKSTAVAAGHLWDALFCIRPHERLTDPKVNGGKKILPERFKLWWTQQQERQGSNAEG